MPAKKVLYVNSDVIKNSEIIWGLLEIGCEVEYAKTVVRLDFVDEDKVEALVKELQKFDFAVSQNFSATIAEACHRADKKYLSWTYDSPLIALYRKEAGYDTNYCFLFDKKECQRLKEKGITTVYHMPLAGNVKDVERVLNSKKTFPNSSYDVSFIGKIYSSALYCALQNAAPKILLDHMEQIAEKMCCNYNGASIWGNLFDNEVEAIYQVLDHTGVEEHCIDHRFMVEELLFAEEIAGRDRIKILNCAATHFDTHLITYHPEQYEGRIAANLHGAVDQEEMYQIFRGSKINLNMTLRSIETGIPQRVMDIMCTGGFVLSNHQAEMEEFFEVGKEIVTFRSEEEFLEKAGYYLKHETERQQIARNGQTRVKRDYNYAVLLKKMFVIANIS